MTVEERKMNLINSISTIENESLLIRMEELIQESTSDIPSAILRLLEKSSKSQNTTPHTTIKQLIDR